MTITIELAWIAMEMAAMTLVAASYAVQTRRLRACHSAPHPAGAVTPVICIDRH